METSLVALHHAERAGKFKQSVMQLPMGNFLMTDFNSRNIQLVYYATEEN